MEISLENLYFDIGTERVKRVPLCLFKPQIPKKQMSPLMNPTKRNMMKSR